MPGRKLSAPDRAAADGAYSLSPRLVLSLRGYIRLGSFLAMRPSHWLWDLLGSGHQIVQGFGWTLDASFSSDSAKRRLAEV
jgi:hypothetical protein